MLLPLSGEGLTPPELIGFGLGENVVGGVHVLLRFFYELYAIPLYCLQDPPIFCKYLPVLLDNAVAFQPPVNSLLLWELCLQYL